MVAPIWKSAALGSSPPIVPSSISASTRSNIAGSSARSRRTAWSVARFSRAARNTTGAVRAASGGGMPRRASSR